MTAPQLESVDSHTGCSWKQFEQTIQTGCPEKKTLLFTSKKGERTYATLSEALNAKDTEMSRRIKYTKEILNSIKKGKDDKLDAIKVTKA